MSAIQATIGQNYDRVHKMTLSSDHFLRSQGIEINDEILMELHRKIYFHFIIPMIKTKAKDRNKAFDRLISKGIKQIKSL